MNIGLYLYLYEVDYFVHFLFAWPIFIYPYFKYKNNTLLLFQSFVRRIANGISKVKIKIKMKYYIVETKFIYYIRLFLKITVIKCRIYVIYFLVKQFFLISCNYFKFPSLSLGHVFFYCKFVTMKNKNAFLEDDIDCFRLLIDYYEIFVIHFCLNLFFGIIN